MPVEYQQADAENLPFNDNHFDNVVSTFGVMFTPNQAQSASELIRVCKPGGKIGMANWTPNGFIGQLFKTLGRYIPPSPGVNSPAAWGTQDFLQQHFGNCSAVDARPKEFNFRYQSAQHWLDLFGTYYGPLLKAFEALDDDKGKQLAEDVIALIGRFNNAKDGTIVVPSEYLEIVITK